jgi:hypothetical protein
MTIAERLLRGKRVDTGQEGEMDAGPVELPEQRRKLPRDAVLVAVLMLASMASFGLGVMAGQEGGGVGKGDKVVIQAPSADEAGSLAPKEATASSTEKNDIPPSNVKKENPATSAAGGQYVASKTGTKYYLPWCGTAKRIRDDNKVWFASKAEAEAAGYEPAKNCKGL